MIESIRISKAATFPESATHIAPLSSFNYFYGANGSGKTTISRVIADVDGFPDCLIQWKANIALEPLVYNRDFVERHFRASDDLPGIFTLGEENAETEERIEAAKRELDSLTQETIKLRRTLEGDDGNGGKRRELAEAEEVLKRACWKQKQIHDDAFKVAFTGYRNKAELFKVKVLQEREANRSELKTLDHLRERATTVFADDIDRVSPVPEIAPQEFLECEREPILNKVVVGKSDVDVASMIERLGNSDWVREGRRFYEANDGQCPFCQQNVAASFADDLEAYFDESFQVDTRAIVQLAEHYEDQARKVVDAIERILASPPSQLDQSALLDKKRILEAGIQVNQSHLQAKRNEPSRRVELQSMETILAEIAEIISAANVQIAVHNATVDNLSRERKALTGQVWRYLIDIPLKDAISHYESTRSAIHRAIENLERQIREKEVAKRRKEQEIKELERSVTSIQPTIDAINAMLLSFGFHGFSLAEATDGRSYRLVRSDGSDAKETLSEGERTFITFLYFYHLLRGSAAESGITRDRVVVFDDPVSSLDSDILFIVSTLIRRLCEEVRSEASSVKQVFVLTHNVYFHKEVTFNKARGAGKLREEAFWTVRKNGGISQVQNHEFNPIRSSYELLWQDVRERRAGNLTVQNSLRRILENYFKLLGGIDLDKIQDRFEGNEKLACRALMSWVNDGSHTAHDDLYVSVDDATVDLYLDVFRKIFEGQGHIEHYNMMMAHPPAPAQVN